MRKLLEDKRMITKWLMCIVFLSCASVVLLRLRANPLVTKAEIVADAYARLDARALFVEMSRNERVAIGVNEDQFVGLFEEVYRPLFERMKLSSHRETEVSGPEAVSAMSTYEATLDNGVKLPVGGNSHLADEGPVVMVTRDLLYLGTLAEGWGASPENVGRSYHEMNMQFIAAHRAVFAKYGLSGIYNLALGRMQTWEEIIAEDQFEVENTRLKPSFPHP